MPHDMDIEKLIQYGDRYVTIPVAAKRTGLTEGAIRTKKARGVWIEGREYVIAPDGRVWIDMRGVQRWVSQKPRLCHPDRPAPTS